MTSDADPRWAAPAPRRPNIDILPPEAVPIPFAVAGLGARLGAQLVDLLLTQLLLGLVLLSLAIIFGGGSYLLVVASLGYFFFRLPYYVLAEIAWNGATLGKRLIGLQVIDAQGGPLTIHAITVRNLLREAEVFLPVALILGIGGMEGWVRAFALAWIGLAVALPQVNRRRQRLGDIIAGTMVIMRPQAVLLPDVAAPVSDGHATGQEAFGFSVGQLDHYGAYELQTLEALVRSTDRYLTEGSALSARMTVEIAAVSEAIRSKIGYESTVSPRDHPRFLSDFYRAQRRYLEEKRLLGDARDDKYHAEDRPDRP